MSVIESVVTAMFTLSLVFVVLAILYFMVMMLSAVLGIRSGRKPAKGVALTGQEKENWCTDTGYTSSGELKLKNVDEKTAAMIMAIVSDESQIPLSELCFKSITAVD